MTREERTGMAVARIPKGPPAGPIGRKPSDGSDSASPSDSALKRLVKRHSTTDLKPGPLVMPRCDALQDLLKQKPSRPQAEDGQRREARAPRRRKEPARSGTALVEDDGALQRRQAFAYRASFHLKPVSGRTRLQILLTLAEGERNVARLKDELNLLGVTLSNHLALLRHGRLISASRDGHTNVYRLTKTGEALVGAVKRLMAAPSFQALCNKR